MSDGLNIDSFGENNTIKRQLQQRPARRSLDKDRVFLADNSITLDITYFVNALDGHPFITRGELDKISEIVIDKNRMLEREEGECHDNGIAMLGWQSLPDKITPGHLDEIQSAADNLVSQVDAFVSLGIGGSYLGIEATIKALTHTCFNQLTRKDRGDRPEIYFLGQNLDPDYLRDTLDILKGKRIGVNVISKSGTTIETAIAFRIFKSLIEKSFGNKSSELIVATTDKSRGALRKIADSHGYKTFEVPDNIGGRFSILTDVGLFGLAIAGIDIYEFVSGFRYMKQRLSAADFRKNPAMNYAALRHLSYKKGKKVEVVAANSAALYQLTRWMEQLFPESEGHRGHGLWVSPSIYSEKLHANGQMVQDGERNIIETFLKLSQHDNNVPIPKNETDFEGLNYLPEKNIDMNKLNSLVIDGPAIAHFKGGVPNMTFTIPRRSPFNIGQFYYLMEKTVALSGYLAGHNPFIQPGVEAYKKAIFALAQKPGTDIEYQKIQNDISSFKRLII